jgi:UDP-N-acetylmuramoyl-L-alanyl-D-glutamate--2,6-diaminopimelate ligase
MSAIQEGLAATVVPGRFELIDRGQDFAIIVDYAHTPDGLENVLTAAKRITEEKLICIFGCGGDRDNGKRPKMGNISAQIADYSVITSDNPRTENPDEIIAQIVSNLPHDTKYVCISERRDAIHHAIATAKSGDVVVIAGKGHEDYQEIHGKRFPFDDRVVASDFLESL